MSTSIGDIAKKKRGRKKTTGLGAGVMVRLHAPVLPALDAYLSALPDTPSRPEAIRRILTEALSAKGYLAEPDKPERAD